MSRIPEMFERLRGDRAALIAYATAYYPDLSGCERIVAAMLDAGADAVELGIPFSDPVMDGPVIQDTSRKALEAGATVNGALELVERLRRGTDRPLVAMTYYNPVFSRGLARFASEAASAGLDAVVIPDLPAEEMGPWGEACGEVGLDTTAFVSLTTVPERIDLAAQAATGFLYCVALLGTTGARDSVSPELPPFLARVREHTSLPLVAGLGISTPEQCAEVGKLADGVIVGSALMEAVSSGNGDLSRLSSLVQEMSTALCNNSA